MGRQAAARMWKVDDPSSGLGFVKYSGASIYWDEGVMDDGWSDQNDVLEGESSSGRKWDKLRFRAKV